MPELPEVETVRRGLAPVMEGGRFAHVEARRGDLRGRCEGFAKRLEGQTVTGLAGARKYLLADLSSVMCCDASRHVGLVSRHASAREAMPGAYIPQRPQAAAHDHVVFEMSNGAQIAFNDSAPVSAR